ncbi:MAG: adenylate/guanylate cyclase domain-containing protein [Casimicrobiaceae bacterium]
MGAMRLRDLRLCGLALVTMAVFGWVHLIAVDVPWLRRLELAALDAQTRFRGPQKPGPETVIVMIDDRTIAELGHWPLPRQKVAELVSALHRAGAIAIGIDILFADPGPTVAGESETAASPGDAALALAVAEAGNVILPFTFEFGPPLGQTVKPSPTSAAYAKLRKGVDYRPVPLTPTAVVVPLPVLTERATLGHMLVAFDVDGAPRYEYPALAYDVDYYPSMAVRVAQFYLGVPWSEVDLELGKGISLGHVYVPTDPQTRFLVNYLGPAATFPTYSLSQVLLGAVPESALRDRIVLVGADAVGTRDTFQSPFTSVMPGVERLATVIDSILHEHYLRRVTVAPWLEVGAMLAAALVLGFAVSRLSLAGASVVAVVLVAAFATSAQVALARYGLWQATAVPIVALMATFLALSLYRHRLLANERRHISRVFKQYLAPQMVDRLVSTQGLPALGGELRELTILFCDLRGFTALSERLPPDALARVANDFLSAASEAIHEYGGTVDKYIGDAIMAFWNAPLDQPEHAALACRAGLRIQERVRALEESWVRNAGTPRLAVGVGINTGECSVGNFGSARRFDYSAVGDAVNVAARLEGETTTYGYGILLGPETAARVSAFATLPLGRVQLRGRKEALAIHALVGDEKLRATAAFRELCATHAQSRHRA